MYLISYPNNLLYCDQNKTCYTCIMRVANATCLSRCLDTGLWINIFSFRELFIQIYLSAVCGNSYLGHWVFWEYPAQTEYMWVWMLILLSHLLNWGLCTNPWNLLNHIYSELFGKTYMCIWTIPQSCRLLLTVQIRFYIKEKQNQHVMV